MNIPPSDVLAFEQEKGWLTIWLDQPDMRNALTAQLTHDLRKALDFVRDDRSVRGITLRGRGGVFCAGADLKAFKSIAALEGDDAVDEIRQLSRSAAEIFEAVNSMPQVVVAIVEGAAMAGGLGLACCADVLVVESQAKFAFTETAIGLTPAQISPYVIQKVGYPIARRLMLTAARFDGEAALAFGLADECGTGAEALLEIERRIREQVLQCAPGAVADIKALILELPMIAPDARVEIAAAHFARRVMSDEGREGLAAFAEKRKPYWAKGTQK